MQKFRDRYGKWGLVAGAAEGLGAAYSMVLASWGVNVIMVDMNKKKMNESALVLKEKFGTEVQTIHADLSKLEYIDTIIGKMQNLGCRLLIYNAAYGPVKRFLDNSTEELDYYIDLNSRMPLQLVHKFLETIPEKQPAGILLMSSLAGLWGTQFVVPYGSTKAFDYNMAEGLYYELKDREIDVMACCAGPIDTPGYRNSQPRKNVLGPNIMAPLRIAEKALKNLGKRPLYIPGFRNQLTYFILSRLFPRSLSTRLMNRTMGNIYVR
jgi:short-subunit dehydrogenase